MTSERWLLIILIENKTIYAIAFLFRETVHVYFCLCFPAGLYKSYANFMKILQIY